MSEQRFDLHTHSTASDGSLSPTELVQRAAACGIEVLALTDHDQTAGLAEAARAAALQPRQAGPSSMAAVMSAVVASGATSTNR